MSGNSGDNDGGQGGQPQGGHPPQGGQPPKGGQPPQGGQPQGGQPQGRATGQSFADQNQLLIDWTKFMSILFAIAGAGVGLFFLIYDALEVELLNTSNASLGGALSSAFALPLLFVPIFLMILIGPLVGAGLASRIQEPPQEIFKIAAGSFAAATAIVSILSIFLISSTFNADLEFGGLLINTILAAVFAAGVAAGGAWTMLNQYPQ